MVQTGTPWRGRPGGHGSARGGSKHRCRGRRQRGFCQNDANVWVAKCGSFSAVSAPIFATKYAFLRISFCDLLDYSAEFLKFGLKKQIAD